MDYDGFVVAAPLPPLDLTNQIDESRPSLGDRVLRPVRVLEMLHESRGLVSLVHKVELPNTTITSSIHSYTHREHSILPESIVRVWSGPNEYDLQVVVLACPTVGPVHVTLHLQTNDPTVTTVLLVIECLVVLKEMAN